MNTKQNSPSPPALRMTRQRKLILEEFKAAGKHSTADDVYARVRTKLPRVSLGTVYRNLDILTRAGRIRKIDVGGGRKQYDGGMHRHYHVRCVECGRVGDIGADRIGDLDAAAERTSGFDILGHELVFQGTCGQCRQTPSEAACPT